jgi:hypothetical protein
MAYSFLDLGEPLWVDLVGLEFLKHRLGQYRQLVAETTCSYANVFTSVEEIEAQFGERGIVDIFSNRVGVELAE